ncbi:MAG: sigma 54-interacting transcriptional regulator [Filifactor alocis]|nr:sigma 54-interacting transcriptional regulator [Filifactor alocis]
MNEKMKMIEELTDNLSMGLIYLNEERKILLCNRRAREMTGIHFDNKNHTHEEGDLQEGDIVLIADNELGADDGELNLEDLKILNLEDPKIKKGDMLLVAGVYKTQSVKPVYKYIRERQLSLPFKLETNYLGFDLHLCIDPKEKNITIRVNDRNYEMNFYRSIGHMVAIDGKSGKIKFFQLPGYSARKEEIAYLLRGRRFLEKKNNSNRLPVIGKHLLDVFEPSELTDKIADVMEERRPSIRDCLYEINKKLFLCSLISSKDEKGEINGLFIALEDAAELEKMLEDRNSIIDKIEQTYKVHEKAQPCLPQDVLSGFVGRSPSLQHIKYLAYKASKTRFNVIITGESGTGKSYLAREIHNLASSDTPFVEVNCNAIAPTLFESELFGYVAGAFTGASPQGRAGYFEVARGGTLFLDEIGELPSEIQAKLLQALQTKVIYRVGSSKPVKVDVRIITATNKNLEEEVEKGRFRQDLFYRINVFPIEIPPLRERKIDIYFLVEQILRRLCEQYQIAEKQFSGEALKKMANYHWPGNVRELENVIERSIVLCESKLIHPEHINIAEREGTITMKERLQKEEERILRECLCRHNNNSLKVMQELDISKSSYYEKCKKYGIDTKM